VGSLIPRNFGLQARWRTERPGRQGYGENCRVGIALCTRIDPLTHAKGIAMHSIVYLVGAVVIILAILGFLGLR
jgi:hypothetical protein